MCRISLRASLAGTGGNFRYLQRKGSMGRNVHRLVHTFGRWRPVTGMSATIVIGRTYRPFLESTATVRTHIHKHGLNTLGAEGALETAYPRLVAIRWQISITMFTTWFKFQHR